MNREYYDKSIYIINFIYDNFEKVSLEKLEGSSIYMTIDGYKFEFYHETCMCHGFRLTVVCDKLRFNTRLSTDSYTDGYNEDNEHEYIVQTMLKKTIEEVLTNKFMFTSTEYSTISYTPVQTLEDGILLALNYLPQRGDDTRENNGTSLSYINKENVLEEIKKIKIDTRFQHPNPDCYILWKGCFLDKDRCYINLEACRGYSNTEYSLQIVPFTEKEDEVTTNE